MAVCLLKGCDNKAAKLSRYCSLACAEAEIKVLKTRLREARVTFSNVEIKSTGYAGESSTESILALRNPYRKKSAAHHAFELFRESGLRASLHREEIIDRLGAICFEWNIALRSPRERVLRVIADVRSRGFELTKDDGGRLRLTGRRVR